MLVNSRKLSESIVSSDGCRLLDRAGANGRLSLLSPFGRDGRAGASEGKGVGLGEGVRNRSGQLARAGVTTPHLNPLPLSKGRGGALQAGLIPMPLLRSLD